MEDLIQKYKERFNENFPIFAPLPEGKDIDDVINECLKKGKPFKPKYKKNVDY